LEICSGALPVLVSVSVSGAEVVLTA
jgi:hypothetical protein